MIWYGVQRARPNQGLGASGLKGPEPKWKYIYLEADLLSHNFTLMWLENLHNFLNLSDNVQFNHDLA